MADFRERNDRDFRGRDDRDARPGETTEVFDVSGIEYVDFKDLDLLKRYVNEQGKLLPRRITNVPAKFQRQLTAAVKRARHLALLPYVADTVR